MALDFVVTDFWGDRGSVWMAVLHVTQRRLAEGGGERERGGGGTAAGGGGGGGRGGHPTSLSGSGMAVATTVAVIGGGIVKSWATDGRGRGGASNGRRMQLRNAIHVARSIT